MAIASEKVSFTGSQGGSLAARLDLPPAPKAFALFAHCFTCSKESAAATRVSRALAAQGIATLRFDFTGLGGSDGEFANTGFSSNVADLVAAAGYLRREHQAPSLLVGHSLGGAAVLAAAARIDEVKAVATLNAPFDPAHVEHLFGEETQAIEAEGEREVCLAGRPFRVRKEFLEDVREAELAPKIRDLSRALLVLHAPTDDLVSIESARRIFETARHPKSFVALDGADHLLSRRSDAEYAATVLSAWASRYLNPADAPEDDDALEHGVVVVRERREGRYDQDVRIRHHRLLADEPEDVGGADRGPSPYDFLLAGLGACTNMTLRMYAEHKKIALRRVKVTLRHEKVHAKDCADCETKQGKLDRIERVIELEGDLDAATRQRLLEIAEKCPVHRTLHSEVKVVSRLKDEAT